MQSRSEIQRSLLIVDVGSCFNSLNIHHYVTHLVVVRTYFILACHTIPASCVTYM